MALTFENCGSSLDFCLSADGAAATSVPPLRHCLFFSAFRRPRCLSRRVLWLLTPPLPPPNPIPTRFLFPCIGAARNGGPGHQTVSETACDNLRNGKGVDPLFPESVPLSALYRGCELPPLSVHLRDPSLLLLLSDRHTPTGSSPRNSAARNLFHTNRSVGAHNKNKLQRVYYATELPSHTHQTSRG